MPRYRLEIEYDGGPYVGWQRQPTGPSVQATVEAAGRALTGEDTPVYAAGRTDSGVHALAMTAHIDLPKAYSDDAVRDALNAHMRPAPVAILNAEEVPESFHARFTCHRRHYLYRVLNRRTPPALRAGRIWLVPGKLDVAAMDAAAKCLLGKHDFTTFRSVQCQADSPNKTLDRFDAEAVGDEVQFRLHAPSFLHNQVRSLVGSLVQVGLGRWRAEDLHAALIAADRAACGPVAPAAGLYFVKADYPAPFDRS